MIDLLYISSKLVTRSKFLADIDECEANNGGCEEICTNTVGSFHCKCHEGQTLQSNKRNCSSEFMVCSYDATANIG